MTIDHAHMRPVEMVALIASTLRAPLDHVSIEVTTGSGHAQFQAECFGHRGEPSSTPTQALDNLLTYLEDLEAADDVRRELFGP